MSKIVPRKQKFVNIDEITALDNFDSLPPQEQNVFHYSDAKGTFAKNWHTDKKRLVGKAPARNVTTVRPVPRGDAKNVSNPLESFHLFVSDDVTNEIVTNTNNSISDFRECFRDILAGNDKCSYCTITDSIEIKAFFGILYVRAALKVNVLSTKTIWYHESSNDLFAVTMSMNRFSFLSFFLTFDDKISRDERGNMTSLLVYVNFLKKRTKTMLLCDTHQIIWQLMKLDILIVEE